MLLFLCVLFICWHIFSLGRYPLPWFDEVYFSSVAQNFSDEGNFIPSVVSVARNNKEALSYGPVYFFLNSIVYDIFGSGLVQARILTLFSGILLIVILWCFSKRLPFLWVVLLVLTDPFLSNNMHEGRMELMACLFCLSSLILYFKYKSGTNLIISSILLGLGLLTTPRMVLFLFPLLAIQLQELFKKEIKIHWFIFFYAIIITMYFSWVEWAFGSIQEWLHYYKEVLQGNHEAPHGYLGGNFYIPKHEYLILVLSILFSVVGVLKNKKKYFTKTIFVALSTIIAFYLFIYDWGVYSVIIIPSFYLIIFDGLDRLMTFSAARVVLILVLMFNLCYQGIKIHTVLNSWEERNPKKLKAFVEQYIPEGERVIGSSQVYYALNGRNPFQLYDKYLTDKERNHLLIKNFDFQYFLLAENEINTPAAKLVIESNQLKEVAHLSTKKNAGGSLIGEVNKHGYAVYLFKRMK